MIKKYLKKLLYWIGALLSDSKFASTRRFIGIQAYRDYSANITDLDYTQKIYVDTHIVFTTVPTSSTDTGKKDKWQ